MTPEFLTFAMDFNRNIEPMSAWIPLSNRPNRNHMTYGKVMTHGPFIQFLTRLLTEFLLEAYVIIACEKLHEEFTGGVLRAAQDFSDQNSANTNH